MIAETTRYYNGFHLTISDYYGPLQHRFAEKCANLIITTCSVVRTITVNATVVNVAGDLKMSATYRALTRHLSRVGTGVLQLSHLAVSCWEGKTATIRDVKMAWTAQGPDAQRRPSRSDPEHSARRRRHRRPPRCSRYPPTRTKADLLSQQVSLLAQSYPQEHL
jgi:hypothetical protein